MACYVSAKVIIRTPLGRLQIISPLLGRHNTYNILAAVATGIALKVKQKCKIELRENRASPHSYTVGLLFLNLAFCVPNCIARHLHPFLPDKP